MWGWSILGGSGSGTTVVDGGRMAVSNFGRIPSAYYFDPIYVFRLNLTRKVFSQEADFALFTPTCLLLNNILPSSLWAIYLL
jgi:hypothetical protein